jgi:hypothetical protein
MSFFGRAGAAGLLSVLLAAAGCNSGNPNAPSSVHGTVTYNGSPVPGGFVVFHLPDGGKLPLPIGANGTYSGEFKEGTYTVAVETESLNPAKKQDYRGQGGGGMAGKYGKAGGGNPGGYKGKADKGSPMPENAGTSPQYVKIPAKYADPANSGLSVTLTKGKNEFNIALTD